MKIYINNLILIFALFAFSSCGAVNSKYHRVTNHKPRTSSLGFSVTPPPGDHWYEKLKNDSLYYLKIAESSNSYSIFTEAREVQLNRSFAHPADFLNHVKKEKNGTITKKSYRDRNTSYLIEKTLSEYCVRYQQNYQDHGMEGLQGRRHVDVNTGGLYCIHPDDKRVGIDVSYVEKTLSDAKTVSYKNEGEMFLASLSLYKRP
jgi:hypothetical protein